MNFMGPLIECSVMHCAPFALSVQLSSVSSESRIARDVSPFMNIL